MDLDHQEICHHLAKLMHSQDPEGKRAAQTFREAFDYVYNGAKTGRFRPEELSKTELTHIGSLVEINLRREFDGFISDGNKMDFSIDSYDVDCKYSKAPFGWSIPLETVGNFAMVCHADDYKSTWRLGFVFVDQEILNKGKNRDQKTTIRSAARDQIVWAWLDAPLPPNTLLHLDSRDVEMIFEPPSGQKRINNLFRIAQRQLIPRGVIETVAQQKDPMKRVRGNGGARSLLKKEGIVILGDYLSHRRIAEELKLPVPVEGSFVSATLIKCDATYQGAFTWINGEYWRLGDSSEVQSEAPDLSISTNSHLENSLMEKFEE
ncbi:NaeI family type II restriction endonuclease [Corynebacterium callunae]|uniref:NaeI family type II restriction endonuclease n=1 Tax=Corynebacterium callunae TaxID=1721 RepID=UPI001FFF8ADF|nr:NaeI family type II restriction endonuclease [Corynebacterium callunae]MCK2200689.1 NaeI family type II restriction endonuclease [Corynebacterium callunae]